MCETKQLLRHYILAGDEKTPRDLLQELALSAEPKIRVRIAENPGASPSTLAELVNDEHVDVRIALTTNGTITDALLIELAGDTDPDVRYAIAENPHMPSVILLFLAADENPYVAYRAAQTLDRVAAFTRATVSEAIPSAKALLKAEAA